MLGGLIFTGILSHITQHLLSSVWSALVPQEPCNDEVTATDKDLVPTTFLSTLDSYWEPAVWTAMSKWGHGLLSSLGELVKPRTR